MKKPIVTVICICFNHEWFVGEAIHSVINQTYQVIELIIVDDNSSDNSVEVIAKIIKDHPEVQFLANKHNLGICRSFNSAFQISKGEYIIDLAADDMLEPQRIEKGVEAFMKNPDAGVHFCDAWYINENSSVIKQHHKRNRDGKLIEKIPQGMIYKDIVQRYFICPPTMMYSRKAVEALGGYDEDLTYEDFDFQVRSSRKFEYIFTDEILVRKRISKKSLSSTQYKPNSRILLSTVKICEKAFTLNRTKEEHDALKKRIFYELGKAVQSRNFLAAEKFMSLLEKMKINDFRTWGYRILLRIVQKGPNATADH
jgi:glycosyltransferase involved in cell wall biosynthesis